MEKKGNKLSYFKIANGGQGLLHITLLDDDSKVISEFYTYNWSFLNEKQTKRLNTYNRIFGDYYHIIIKKKEMENLAHEMLDDEKAFTIILKNNENFDFISLTKNYPHFNGINLKNCKYSLLMPDVYILEDSEGKKLIYNIRTAKRICYYFDSIQPSNENLNNSDIVATIPLRSSDDENGLVYISCNKDGKGKINDNVTLLINKYRMSIIQAYSRLQQRYLVKDYETDFDSVMSTECIEYLRRLLYLDSLGYLEPRKDITEEECERLNKENEQKAVSLMLIDR